jgi:hypothetical protein
VTFKKSPAQPKASRSLKIDVACAMKRKKTGGKSGRRFQVFAERGPEYSGAARFFFAKLEASSNRHERRKKRSRRFREFIIIFHKVTTRKHRIGSEIRQERSLPRRHLLSFTKNCSL